MSIEVGAVLKGKVTGIQSFGAFVALEGENTQGLVHISEVSNTYVKDINEFLQVGQEVEVKVIKLDEASNKISLSMRALMPNPEGNKNAKKDSKEGAPRRRATNKKRGGSAPVSYKSDPDEAGYTLLADKLKDLGL
ncbi:MAG: S1 RNA-binding domain-containing protein [Lachnospiraceae bacterium]|jgi:general stress protein 13|nr:S1 RNA-binding domain-containing protein [Lachnospiraceae bacterium]